MYDVVIVGGSISGLLCARQIAGNGFSVLVLEEDSEIGTPEHCSGLVSSVGLDDLGIILSQKTFEHIVKTAEIFAPDGNHLVIDAKKQRVIEVSRRELDKQVAHQAQKNGAQIRTKIHVQELQKNGVQIKDQIIKCEIIVDARGVASLIQKDKEGILASAQYEIYADWIDGDKVQVYLDQQKYPGFFAWVIPSASGKGKAGVAGKGINPANILEDFLKSKGKYSIIRKVFAPIWVRGPIKNVICDNIVIIGDAAGQTKPTTAGGIYTAGMGGILAGDAISKYLKSNDKNDLKEYPKQWNKKFAVEFEKQLLVRKVLEQIDNDALCKIFSTITQKMVADISKDDFDFHTSSIIKLLGVKGSLKTMQVLISEQLKKQSKLMHK